MSEIDRFALDLANWIAKERPKPLAAPVMTALFPS